MLKVIYDTFAKKEKEWSRKLRDLRKSDRRIIDEFKTFLNRVQPTLPPTYLYEEFELLVEMDEKESRSIALTQEERQKIRKAPYKVIDAYTGYTETQTPRVMGPMHSERLEKHLQLIRIRDELKNAENASTWERAMGFFKQLMSIDNDCERTIFAEKELAKEEKEGLVSSRETLEKIINGDIDGYYKFQGYNEISTAWMMYLQRELGDLVCYLEGDVSFVDGKLVMESLMEEIEKCEQNRVRFSVTILIVNNDHANALVFDHLKKTITLFEPNGHKATANGLDEALEKLVAKNPDSFNGYVRPMAYCPNYGPQSRASRAFGKKTNGRIFGIPVMIESDGFCLAWAALFIHKRILYPDQTNQEISEMFSNDPIVLQREIKSYMASIMREIVAFNGEPKWLESTTDIHLS